jgi:hypothetical protein
MPQAGTEARWASVVVGFIESSFKWRRAELPGTAWVRPGLIQVKATACFRAKGGSNIPATQETGHTVMRKT